MSDPNSDLALSPKIRGSKHMTGTRHVLVSLEPDDDDDDDGEDDDDDDDNFVHNSTARVKPGLSCSLMSPIRNQ